MIPTKAKYHSPTSFLSLSTTDYSPSTARLFLASLSVSLSRSLSLDLLSAVSLSPSLSSLSRSLSLHRTTRRQRWEGIRWWRTYGLRWRRRPHFPCPSLSFSQLSLSLSLPLPPPHHLTTAVGGEEMAGYLHYGRCVLLVISPACSSLFMRKLSSVVCPVSALNLTFLSRLCGS